MKKAAPPTTSKSTGIDPIFTVGTVALQLLDTTWRIAIPVLGLAVLGIVADRHFGTKPWLTLLAAAFGFVIAGLLVKRELDNLKGDNS
jgi:hypothetical protein